MRTHGPTSPAAQLLSLCAVALAVLALWYGLAWLAVATYRYAQAVLKGWS